MPAVIALLMTGVSDVVEAPDPEGLVLAGGDRVLDLRGLRLRVVVAVEGVELDAQLRGLRLRAVQRRDPVRARVVVEDCHSVTGRLAAELAGAAAASWNRPPPPN